MEEEEEVESGYESSPPVQKLLTLAESVDHGGSACLVLSSVLLSIGNGLPTPAAGFSQQKHWQPLFIHPESCVTETGLQLSPTERENRFI